jgi:hypothetical protein
MAAVQEASLFMRPRRCWKECMASTDRATRINGPRYTSDNMPIQDLVYAKYPAMGQFPEGFLISTGMLATYNWQLYTAPLATMKEGSYENLASLDYYDVKILQKTWITPRTPGWQCCAGGRRRACPLPVVPPRLVETLRLGAGPRLRRRRSVPLRPAESTAPTEHLGLRTTTAGPTERPQPCG